MYIFHTCGKSAEILWRIWGEFVQFLKQIGQAVGVAEISKKNGHEP